MNSPQFDELDYAILYHLQENAQQPMTDIADSLGVVTNTVSNRIKNLEAEGAIDDYTINTT